MKKFLLILLGTLIALPALARDFEYTYEGQTLTYTVIDEDAMTCGVAFGESLSGNLVIPDVANDGAKDYSVTSIGEDAFSWGCYGLTSVVIGNSVTSIGDYAFYGCSGLTSVTIPNSVTSIGDYAFSDCSGLTSVAIPNSVTSIGDCAFYRCYGLTSVVIGNSVTSIGDYAFSVCSGLTSVAIPNSVTSIGDGAFSRCGLTSIEVSAENPNYASLDGVLFSKDYSNLILFPCGRNGEYDIPSSVTSIGDYAFYYCWSLRSVTIPNSVTSIGRKAFSHIDLRSVTIPNSVTSIGDYAFYYCSLTSVTIPNSVTSIGREAFGNCGWLTSVEVSPENPNYASLEGVLFSKDYSTLVQVPGGRKGEYDIPNSVTSIGDGAFGHCIWLTSVNIPNSVKSIGEDAFSDCSGLTSVAIPNSVTSIGEDAFSDCSGLTSVAIPNSVTSIGERAFSYCIGLTSVYYLADDPIQGSYNIFESSTYNNATLYMTEAGVEKGRTIYPWQLFANINEYGFSHEFTYTYEGQTLKYNIIDDVTKTCKVAKNNNISGDLAIPDKAMNGNFEFTVTSIGEEAFQYCENLTSVNIPNSVTSIGNTAFFACKELTSVVIGNSVTTIGDAAFSNCFGLTSVTIGNSVESIGNTAFGYCSKLTSVNIPNSVTSIDNGAFWYCSGLTSVVIGNSVQTIDAQAFFGCNGLTSVTIPNAVTSIGYGAFGDCNSLTTIEVSPENPNYASLDGVLFSKDLSTLIQCPGGVAGDYEIPSSVTSIAPLAFYGCSSVTSVEISNSVTSIGYWAFDGCSGLTSVEIPNTVTSIGWGAFSDCSGLTSVYYLADEPIEGEYNVFSESTYKNATLYMSEKGIEKGRTINPWKNFANIEVYDFDGIEAVDADIDTDKPCEVYSISGAKVGNTTESLAPGVYIVRQGNAAKKITVKQ